MSERERRILREVAVILQGLVPPTYEELLALTGQAPARDLAEAA